MDSNTRPHEGQSATLAGKIVGSCGKRCGIPAILFGNWGKAVLRGATFYSVSFHHRAAGELRQNLPLFWFFQVMVFSVSLW